MKGSIDYLRKVRDICKTNKGSCKQCPLGEKRKLEDNYCPRLTDPRSWSDERISDMVKIEGVGKQTKEAEHKTLIDLVAEWDEAVLKNGYVN